MNRGERTRRHPSAVERIANWSARHPKAAVAGWFGLVAAVFVTGQLLGTQSLPQYDPGQAGLGERALHQLDVTTPPQESVLIQPRGAAASRLTFASDPRMRQADRQVAVALSRLRSSPAGIRESGLVSADGHSALVTFLFGLSTDYHVFILSRVRERYAQGMTTADALTSGIASSAGVVTSAAVIMVAVFSIFATLSFVDIKTLGVGPAVAVLVDATAVRGILVPAAIAILRERTWYLPRWLSWLPE